MTMTLDKATSFLRMLQNGQIDRRPIGEWIGLREACGVILAHLTQPAQAVDGWVMVPREPTKAMLAAYEHVRSGADWQETVFRLTKRQLARHKAAYTAMLAAALQESKP